MAQAQPDDRSPVLVGCGQISQREPDPRVALAPLDLMAQAAQRAADDSGAGAQLLQSLDVKTRVFIDVFDEQIGMSFAPSLEGLDGRLMLQSALRDAVVAGRLHEALS